jgi:AAA family ATP:ADP antiporter
MSERAQAPALPMRRALPFAVLLFLLVAAHGLLETARDGLFLTEQPVTRLPWLYLAVTVGVLVLTPLQRRLWSGQSQVVLPLTFTASGAVTLAFWLGTRSHSAVLPFYVWTALFSSLVFVQFWLTADEAFGVGEAKQSFGFIAAGGLLGAVSGSAAARLVLGYTNPRVLLLISAGLTFAAVGLGYVLARACRGGPATEPEMTVASAVPGYMRGDPYLRLLAVLALLTAASATLIDYLFKAAVASGVPPEGIPRLVANVYLGQNTLALLVELVVVRHVLQTTGVTRSLALLPLVVLGGASGYALGGGLAVLLGLRILDGGLRPSLYRVGTELLFLPIGAAQRRVIKPSIDTLGQRGGQAVVSLLLLAVPQLPDRAQMGAVTLLLTVVAVGWVGATGVLRRHYLDRFQQQLGAGRVQVEGVGSLDLASAEILVNALGSSNTREVLTALDVLTRSGRLGLIPALILYHPEPVVVRAALGHFAGARRTDVDALLPFLFRHADEQVRAAVAARWLRAGNALEELRPALEDASPRVRAAALVALSSSDSGQDAREAIARIVSDGLPEARRALAWAIANAPRADLLPTVEGLFLGGDTETRRELLRAAPGLPTPPPEFVSGLIGLLADPALRSGARDALVSVGDPAREQLETLLLARDTPFAIDRELPATLARFPPASAAAPLLRRLVQPRGGLARFRSLRALNQLRRNNPRLALDGDALASALELELASVLKNRGLRLTGVRLGIARERENPAGTLLIDLLQDKERRATERVFRVLSLLFPAGRLEQVYLGARSESPRRREAAREVLVELLHAPLRERVLMLLEPDQVDRAVLQRLLGPEPTTESFVTALLAQSSEVVRLLTPCLAHAEGWVSTVPRLRAGPRCGDAEAAALADQAIQQLERRAEQRHG